MTNLGEPLERLAFGRKMTVTGAKLGNRFSDRIRRGRDAGILTGQAPGIEKRLI